MRTPNRRFVLVAGFSAAAALLAGRALFAADDASWDAWVARARTHYLAAERELRAADVSGLSPAQRAARSRALDALHAYQERAEFGRNTDFPGARVPYFVDDGGRRCAVAEILHVTGEDPVVARVATTANHAWVADLEDDAEFRVWLDRNGLTFTEAARIQAPAPPRFAQPAPPDRSPDTGTSGPKAPDQPRTPTDTPPSSSSGSSSGGSSAGGRSAGGTSSPGADASAAPGESRGGRDGSGGADAGSWWLWWEYAKLDYLKGNPLRLGDTPGTAAKDPFGTAAQGVDARRARAAETFTAALADADSGVRAAAAIALGRTAGEAAVPRILPLLRDADGATRDRAILALGATGSRSGADALSAIARGEDTVTGSSPDADSRALAILSLAVARRYGLEASFDDELATLVENAKKRDLDTLGTAALVHRVLAAGPGLDRVATDAAKDANAPAPERGRAIESLGARADKRSAALLRDLLGDRRVDVRRSAAIAFGDSPDPLAVVQMKTAYELESEPLTRAFLLLSLGRKGGLPALDFLRNELKDGPEAMRPWAALGLGILARPDGDIEARAALRAADLPPSAHGAVWIAQGLARDESAVPAIARQLREAQSPSERAHAATALALVGSDAAHEALGAAIAGEKSEYTRVVIAWGLGSMRRPGDVEAILGMAETLGDPGLTGVAAVALGFHGSAAAADGALRRAADPKLSPAARAAAIEAAGLLLSRRPGLALAEASRRTNFAVMPGWLRTALSVTL